MKYKIAKIVFEMTDEIQDFYWKRFGKNENNIDSKICWYIKKDHKYCDYSISQYDYLFTLDDDLMLSNKMWEDCSIIIKCNESENFYTFLLQIFYAKAIYHHMIQMHSSLVKYKEKGIMFLGPSGIGKTTQAELWYKYLNALIVNGDMVFIEKNNDQYIGWGTPWHGASPYCENMCVPIVALIVLKQGNTNVLRELKDFEKVKYIGKQLYFPTWVDNGTEMALDILNHLLQNVPVYELTNKADKESVELVKQEIFGHE